MKSRIKSLLESNRSFSFWILVILGIKLLLFAYFALQFSNFWEKEMLGNHLVVKTGDSYGYYAPAENAVTEGDYNSTCRMPGALPIYWTLRLILNASHAEVGVIVIQFLISCISVFVLGLFAESVFKKKWIFPITILIYALSSFVSIWDHYLLSDSLSTSFSIFCVYFLKKYFDTTSRISLLISSLFLIWAIFFRQIFLVFFPIVAIIILVLNWKSPKRWIVDGLLYILPFLLAVFFWSEYTKSISGKRILLTSPISECFSTYSPAYMSITSLLIDMGYGEPFWTEGSITQWIIRSKEEAPMPLVPQRHFNSQMNEDSLARLRSNYRNFLKAEGSIRDSLQTVILESTNRFASTYRQENAGSYYFLNKLRHLKIFVFPLRLDNLPGPAFSEMNFFQKGVKVFYLLLYTLVGSIGFILLLFSWGSFNGTQRLFMLFPAVLVFSLAVILGFVEQRYFVPVYPFLVVLIAYYIQRFFK